MRRRFLAFLVLVEALAIAPPSSAQGPEPVGFRFLWTLDASRSWDLPSDSTRAPRDPVGRPLRISIWYPARPGTEPMPFAGYLDAPTPEPAFQSLADVVRAHDRASYEGLFDGDSAALSRLLETPTGVARDAEPAIGPFPLVLYSAGWGNRSSDNTMLAESLASHGYMVVTVPQLAARRPRIASLSTIEDLEAQARDLETAMAAVFGLPFVDRRRVAAVGYSTGGRIALMLAERNPNVNAAAGLDPSYAFSDDAARIHVEESPDPSRLRIPILTIHRADPEAQDLSVLDSAPYASRWTFAVQGAGHGDFSDDTPLRRRFGLRGEADPAVHSAVVGALLQFLDRTIGPDAVGEASPPALEGLPTERVTALADPGIPAPTAAAWASLVESAGLPTALQRLRDLEADYPGVEVADEVGLNDRAYYLIDRGRVDLAVDVLRLAAAAHPSSVNIHDSLGEVCLRTGDSTCAAAAYRRVLALLPDSDLPEWLADYYRRTATRVLDRVGAP